MYLHHPQTARLVELLESGTLGEIRTVEVVFAFDASADPSAPPRLSDPALAGGGILDEGLSVLHKSLVTGNVAGSGGGIFANFAQSPPVLDRTRVVGNHPDDCVC